MRDIADLQSEVLGLESLLGLETEGDGVSLLGGVFAQRWQVLCDRRRGKRGGWTDYAQWQNRLDHARLLVEQRGAGFPDHEHVRVLSPRRAVP